MGVNLLISFSKVVELFQDTLYYVYHDNFQTLGPVLARCGYEVYMVWIFIH